MDKKIVSTCSPNNNMYWVCIQYIVKKFPAGLFLVTPYVPIRALVLTNCKAGLPAGADLQTNIYREWSLSMFRIYKLQPTAILIYKS